MRIAQSLKPCACVCTHGHSVQEDERPAGCGIGDLASSQRFKPTWHAAGPRLWSDSTRFQSGQTTCQQCLSVVRASAEYPEQFALPTQHIDQLSNAEAIPSQIPRSLRVRDGTRSYLGKVNRCDGSENMHTTTPRRRLLVIREMLWSGYGPEHPPARWPSSSRLPNN